MTQPTLSQKEFQVFRKFIHEKTGIALGDNKGDLVRSRLVKRLRINGLDSFRKYFELIESDPSGDELDALIDAISTNKTDFFREDSHFEYLENNVLPDLIDKKRKNGNHRFRVWSAAASTGEEPYTLSIVLNRLHLLDPALWDTRILATDISGEALGKARQGEYAPDRVGPIPPVELRAHFTKLPSGRYRAKNTIKKPLKFGRLNLLDKSYPFQGPFDFIFCRNVMIYFDPPTRELLVNRMFRYLIPGGHLFIGKSESLSGLKHPLDYVMPATYKRAV